MSIDYNRLSDKEIEEIIDIYKGVFGTDIKIDFNEGDIKVDGNGDIDMTGVVIGKKLAEVEEGIKQNILLSILTNGVSLSTTSGIKNVTMEDLIGVNLSEEIQKILLKTIIMEALMNNEYVSSVNRIDIIKRYNDFYIDIEVGVKYINININESIVVGA